MQLVLNVLNDCQSKWSKLHTSYSSYALHYTDLQNKARISFLLSDFVEYNSVFIKLLRLKEYSKTAINM